MFDRAGRTPETGFISGPRRRFECKFGQAGMPRGAAGNGARHCRKAASPPGKVARTGKTGNRSGGPASGPPEMQSWPHVGSRSDGTSPSRPTFGRGGGTAKRSDQGGVARGNPATPFCTWAGPVVGISASKSPADARCLRLQARESKRRQRCRRRRETRSQAARTR